MCTPPPPRSGPPPIRQGRVGWTQTPSAPRPTGPMGRDRVRLPGKGRTRKLYQETPDMCRPAHPGKPQRPDYSDRGAPDERAPWDPFEWFRRLPERWPILTYGPRWVYRLADHDPTCRYRRTVRRLTLGATP